MYLFFDKQGVLKEIINDSKIRLGNDNANKFYVYLENDPEINDLWVTIKRPDDSLTLEKSMISTTETKEIPYDKNRDLKYFKDYTKYKFYTYTLTSEDITSNGLYLATFRAEKSDEIIIAQGLVTFNVENSVIKVDNNITQSQYDYIIKFVSEKVSSILSAYIKKIEYNSAKFELIFTKQDDSKVIVDLPLEEAIKSITMDENFLITITKIDNSTSTIDLGIIKKKADQVELDKINQKVTNLEKNKVDKEEGKGLSTNDFTNEYKSKVDANTSARHTHTNKSVLDQIKNIGGANGLATLDENSKLKQVAIKAEQDENGNNIVLTYQGKTLSVPIGSYTTVEQALNGLKQEITTLIGGTITQEDLDTLKEIADAVLKAQDDIKKLQDSIDEIIGGSVPPATETTLGVVKVGSGLRITKEGLLSLEPLKAQDIATNDGSNVEEELKKRVTTEVLNQELAKKQDVIDESHVTFTSVTYAEGVATFVGTLKALTESGEVDIPFNFDLPMVAGENVTIDADESGQKIVVSASGGKEYVLPVATNTILGGVKANPKTDEDTQEVHVDSEGKLWTKPSGGGGGTGSGSKLYLHTFTMDDEKAFGIVMSSSKTYTTFLELVQGQEVFISYVWADIGGKNQAFIGFSAELPKFSFVTYDGTNNSLVKNEYDMTSSTFTDRVKEIPNL